MHPEYITLPDGYVIDKAEVGVSCPISQWIVWDASVSAEGAPTPYHTQLQRILGGKNPKVMVIVSTEGQYKRVEFPAVMHGKIVNGFNPMHAEYAAIKHLNMLREKAKQP